RLAAAEAEVEAASLDARPREADGPRIAARGGPLDCGPTGVAEPEQLRRLVECLADGVIARAAEARVLARTPRQGDARLTAGHDEPQNRQGHRIVHRALEVDRQEMSLEMVDPDQPEVAALGDALRQGETDQQRSDQTGATRGGDPLHVGERQARAAERLV